MKKSTVEPKEGIIFGAVNKKKDPWGKGRLPAKRESDQAKSLSRHCLNNLCLKKKKTGGVIQKK